MARYKYIDTNPRFLAVDLARQLLPGTFEHALNHLLDHAIDLSHFDARFRNDTTGAPASPPAMLLKVVLFAYSQGIVSSRGIERHMLLARAFDAAAADDALRVPKEHDLEQHGRRIDRRAGRVVPKTRIKVRQIDRPVEQMVERVLERAGRRINQRTSSSSHCSSFVMEASAGAG